MKLLSLLVESESFWVNRNVTITATGGPEVFWLNIDYDKNPEDFGTVIQDSTALRFDYNGLKTRNECLNHLLKHRQFYNENELISIIKMKFAVQPSNNFDNLFFVRPLGKELKIIPKNNRMYESLNLNKKVDNRYDFPFEINVGDIKILFRFGSDISRSRSYPYKCLIEFKDSNLDDFTSKIQSDFRIYGRIDRDVCSVVEQVVNTNYQTTNLTGLIDQMKQVAKGMMKKYDIIISDAMYYDYDYDDNRLAF